MGVVLTAGLLLVGGLALTTGRPDDPALDGFPSQTGAVPVEDAVVFLVALAAAALCAVLAVLTALGTLTVLPRDWARSWARGVAPRWAPRAGGTLLVLGLCTPTANAVDGVAQVTTGQQQVQVVLSVARGTPVHLITPEDRGSDETELPLPDWRPTRPVPVTPPDTVELVTRGAAEEVETTVVRGDTLWAIAARHLGPDAGAEEIAAAWPRWYAANRAVIGPDPDLIRPGQQLRAPGLDSTRDGS